MKTFWFSRLIHSVLLALFFVISSAKALTEAERNVLWLLKEPNHFAIMRHTYASQALEPEFYEPGPCQTLHNVSEVGRRQAIKVADKIRAAGIDFERVYTTQWCLGNDAAKIMNIAPVQSVDWLDSFYSGYMEEGVQTRKLRQWLNAIPLSEPVLLVTHQVNITSLFGSFPAFGDLFVVHRQPNGVLRVVGQVRTLIEASDL